MDWNPQQYGPEALNLLQLAGNGERLMPLVSPRCSDSVLAAQLRRPARELFPHAINADGAHAGLWLYCGFFEESHRISQDLKTADGNYWHAILHRMEPDAWNAGYWFRRVGQHSIFAELERAAANLGYTAAARWDPLAFIDACEHATPANRLLLEQVQLAEWQLLFHHCAKAK